MDQVFAEDDHVLPDDRGPEHLVRKSAGTIHLGANAPS